MIFKIKNFYSNTSTAEKISLILISLLPLSFFLGNAVINTFLFLISILFFYDLTINRDFSFLKNPIFLLLIFFFFSILVNISFSQYPLNSLPRVLKIFFIIGFILQIKRMLQKDEKGFENSIFSFWFIIFLVTIVDIVFEIIFGHNIIGFKSYMPGRIASFFNDELVVGYFFSGFCLFFLIFLVETFPLAKKLSLPLVLLLILISLLIGERSNFIKSFLIISICYLTVFKLNWKSISAASLILILSFLLIVNFDRDYKSRYTQQIKQIFQKDGINKFLKDSHYGAHYDGAYQVYKNYPIFGVGIKNFRMEVGKPIYKKENSEFYYIDGRWATHPHQIHYEFLSETGIFGYLSFLIFILSSIYLSLKSYLKKKNNYQLSSILFVLISLAPLIPSGSFFSTFSSGIFWINYALMISYIRK